MCRDYFTHYNACGHHTIGFTSQCASHPYCEKERCVQVMDRFCNDCLLSPALERRREDHNDMQSRRDTEAGRAVLACAAAPGHRRRVTVGQEEYYIDNDNTWQFNERLSMVDGSWLARLEEVLNVVIWEQLLDANVPDPTHNEIELYLKIREASMFHEMDKNNDVRNGIEPVDHKEEIVKRLQKVATPTPIPEDNPECMICYEAYGKATEGGVPEDAVRLPCGHVYGIKCLESWCEGFVPGSGRFTICTLCRKDFEVLSLREAAVGIGIGSRQTPWWLLLFRSVSNLPAARRRQNPQILRWTGPLP